jgi:hypothetical protein
MNERIDLSTGEIIDVAAALSPVERRTKARCDLIIQAGKKHFLRTCRALARYNRLRLYREDYETFDKYVKAELGITRGRAYQMIAAGTMSTAVDIQNEAQARELMPLPEEVRPLVWDMAKGMAKEIVPGKPVPTRFIKAAINVLVTAEVTGGYVDTGDGTMHALDASVTQEVHETVKRQRQHIRDHIEQQNGDNGRKKLVERKAFYTTHDFKRGTVTLWLGSDVSAFDGSTFNRKLYVIIYAQEEVQP